MQPSLPWRGFAAHMAPSLHLDEAATTTGLMSVSTSIITQHFIYVVIVRQMKILSYIRAYLFPMLYPMYEIMTQNHRRLNVSFSYPGDSIQENFESGDTDVQEFKISKSQAYWLVSSPFNFDNNVYFYSSFALLADDSPGDSTILSTHQEAVTQPPICDLNYFNQGQARKDISCSGEGVFENTIDDSLQRLSDLKLSKVHTFISAASLISLMQSELLNLFSLCNVLLYPHKHRRIINLNKSQSVPTKPS